MTKKTNERDFFHSFIKWFLNLTNSTKKKKIFWFTFIFFILWRETIQNNLKNGVGEHKIIESDFLPKRNFFFWNVVK